MKRHAEDFTEQPDKEKVSKHTLESDEELEEDEEGGRMNDEELKVGQEAETINFDGDIQITPFNLKEELEDDGHFDSSGTFIFKKSNEAGDNWLEDVDWSEVREREEMTANSDQNPPANIEAANDALPEITGDQRTNLYREVCRLLNAKETVLRALKRMGPTKAATKGGVQRRNWIRRRDGTTVDNKESKSTGGDPEGFAHLTELANDLLGSGDFDIYQKTKEVLEDLVASSEKKINGDSELDALGAVIDDEAGIERPDEDENDDGGPKWIMKKGASADADSEVEGPYSEGDIRRWISQGIFANPARVFIKLQGSNEPFQPLPTVKFEKT